METRTNSIQSSTSKISNSAEIYEHYLQKDTFYVIADALTRQGKQRILWISVLSLATAASIWQIYDLLSEVIKKPTISKVEYQFHDELELPRLMIFQNVERMLNYSKIQTFGDSFDYNLINAVEWGLGIVRRRDRRWNRTSQDLINIEKQYRQAIRTYGSILNARHQIHEKYGLDCVGMFQTCETGNGALLNCCHIFELTWNMNGAVYSTRPNALKIGMGNLNSFRAWINMAPYVPIRPEEREEPKYPQYIVAVDAALDQTPQWSAPEYLSEGAYLFYHVRQRRRKLMGTDASCTENNHLQYFPEYTINNCVWEKTFLVHMADTLNLTCQLPLLKLLNPSIQLQNPCDYAKIAELFQLRPDWLPCDYWCLKRTRFDPNTTSKADCRYPCDYTEYEFTTSLIYDQLNQQPKQFGIQIQYETTEVQVVEETLRYEAKDYFGLLGGILGLWLGASLISIVHLCTVLATACSASYSNRQKSISDSYSMKGSSSSERQNSSSEVPKLNL